MLVTTTFFIFPPPRSFLSVVHMVPLFPVCVRVTSCVAVCLFSHRESENGPGKSCKRSKISVLLMSVRYRSCDPPSVAAAPVADDGGGLSVKLPVTLTWP